MGILRSAALILVYMLCLGCQRDRLSALKVQAKQKYTAESASLLKAVPSGNLEIGPGAKATSTVALKDLTIHVLKEDQRKEEKHTTVLYYPQFKAIVFHATSNGQEFAALPSTWGHDDLEKMRTVSLASEAFIDKATSPQELEDAVLRLTSKPVLSPIGATWRVDDVNAPAYVGLLSGDFEQSIRMSLWVRPRNGSPLIRIEFLAEKGSKRDILRPFLEALESPQEH